MSTIGIVIEESREFLTGWVVDYDRGVIVYEALLIDDPYFSKFLDAVLVEGDVPEELVLTGSMKDLILRLWNNYYNLVNWMKEVGPPFLDRLMIKFLGRNGGSNAYLDAPHYDDMLLLSPIMNIPDYWEMCTLSPTRSDPVVHLELIGRQVLELDTESYPIDYANLDSPDELLLWIIAVCARVGEDVKVILYGSLRLAMLYKKDQDRIASFDSINWKLTLELIKKFNREGSVYNTIATLAGEGRLDEHVIMNDEHLGYTGDNVVEEDITHTYIAQFVPEVGYVHGYGMRERDAKFLYDVSLDLFSGDTSPRDLGLETMTLGKSTYRRRPVVPINRMAMTVPVRHDITLRLIEWYYNEMGFGKSDDPLISIVPDEDGVYYVNPRLIEANAKLLLEVLGEKGVRLILSSLINARDTGTSISRQYITALEGVLNGSLVIPSHPRLEASIVKKIAYINR